MLINFTKKNSEDMAPLFKDPSLLNSPAERAVSRLAYKTDLFKYKLLAEPIVDIKAMTAPPMTWSQCCEHRALELLALKKERYFLSYSGGIDSSVAMVALLKHWPKKELERVTILLSHHSIEENPSFFNNHLAGFPLVNSSQDPSQMLIEKNGLMVTGELGDQLFGSDILGAGSTLFGDKILTENYRDHAAKLFAQVVSDPANGEKVFEHFHPITAEAPFPIRTTHDFFWWYNFTQKWQHVKFRFCELTTWNMGARYGSHVQHFFDSVHFQKWSMTSHDQKIQGTWASYKTAAKNYLYEFTKDPAQLQLLKVQSLAKTYVLSAKRIAIKEDYGVVQSVDEMREYVRDGV